MLAKQNIVVRAGREVAVARVSASTPRLGHRASQSCNCAACSSKQSLSVVPARRRNSVRASAQPQVNVAAVVEETIVASAPAPTLADRLSDVRGHFPGALGVDDFLARVEMALCAYGFTGENSIAMTNLCRDEITAVLKDKIEAAFGSSFNTNGLGAVLTCGVTGIGAGLSHAPICSNDGRERYVFFSFPHIAVDASGEVGTIFRPGRPGASCACGALIKCLGELKKEGVAPNCKVPGVHDPLDPEYTILKQRLARRIKYEGLDINNMSLTDITKVAERTITDDLEYLIEKAVNIQKADYAVVTGVEIHNWGTELRPDSPSMEFIFPTKIFVCVNGEKTYLDLSAIPPLAPRMISLMAQQSMGSTTSSDADLDKVAHTYTPVSSLVEVPMDYLASRVGGGAGAVGTKKMAGSVAEKPEWLANIVTGAPQERDAEAPTMDSPGETQEMMLPVRTSFTSKGMVVYIGDTEEESGTQNNENAGNGTVKRGILNSLLRWPN